MTVKYSVCQTCSSHLDSCVPLNGFKTKLQAMAEARHSNQLQDALRCEILNILCLMMMILAFFQSKHLSSTRKRAGLQWKERTCWCLRFKEQPTTIFWIILIDIASDEISACFIPHLFLRRKLLSRCLLSFLLCEFSCLKFVFCSRLSVRAGKGYAICRVRNCTAELHLQPKQVLMTDVLKYSVSHTTHFFDAIVLKLLIKCDWSIL